MGRGIVLFTLISIVLSIATPLIVSAEVEHATGKLLVYEIISIENGSVVEDYYMGVIVLTVSDKEVFVQITGIFAWWARIRYEPDSNTLVFNGSITKNTETGVLTPNMFPFIFSYYSFPALFTEELPDLNSITVVARVKTSEGIKKTSYTVDFTEVGMSAKRTSYMGYDAVEVTWSTSYGTGKSVIRTDGILLYTESETQNMKGISRLLVEDDIAKIVQEQQPDSSTISSPQGTTTTSVSMPPTATTNTQPGTQPQAQSQLQPQQNTAITPNQQWFPTTYVIAVAIAVIAIIAVVLILRKR